MIKERDRNKKGNKERDINKKIKKMREKVLNERGRK